MEKELDIEIIKKETDLLIIGGGAAGIFAAVKAKEMKPECEVTIMEKSNIKWSGCLAAGINAINAYITPDETPESFLEYVKNDNNGVVRDDLVYTIAQQLNQVTEEVERWGLPIKKDENDNYLARSRRSIEINGDEFKPILANRVEEEDVEILNRVVATNYLVENGEVYGAFGFSIRENRFYVIRAKAVICATGGASGIYKPNNEGGAKHKTWYPPFNAGAGYAMGVRAGAEMTSFEMRFIALRVKDVIAPTGTLALGADANQINAYGENYLKDYDRITTPIRLQATLRENKLGRGPCYLDVSHLDEEGCEGLRKKFLNMSPSIVLQWADREVEPNEEPIEITGSEPYIVGGHGQAGYWIGVDRSTTLKGLYAAGDVAGGAPKKYVTGAFVEGKIAVENALKLIKERSEKKVDERFIWQEFQRVYEPLQQPGILKPQELEIRLQKVMDEYAGGISSGYQVNRKKLLIAKKRLKQIEADVERLKVENLHQLMAAHEVVDRILIAKVVVAHLLHRKETRWPVYQANLDFPEQNNQEWFKFVNSVYDSKREKVLIKERKCHDLEEVGVQYECAY
ncbi:MULTISPECIES: adenylyl-sulfate reductase subunit alpha [unclassified Candidatus Frackibacter]|uniref:adenylyl-sulfate reductase subunit alpha n=1 Tax=unclassified Candidatus Frackibacter TaxID=2648818 RepID=UPI000882345F|nr:MULTISPECIES: adenylyl-sulfate reductase subunit alpha [unclassified Candidatus Frackibacter]SDC81228.1 dissimilatory adenylylsulfate reductase alpha subunit precursor [Candidatus Frackibacter sp. WG11]SEM93632.1 dissimilatory adenylylsulfate reductase alpha subunit precursor [Candidatus Frackibacter sp. WG12]SFM02310.1 dissimilatory adenylylsulfate reductase alpha subunit precursor [Candidatus Frackibacter sp. WG13]